MAGFAAAFTAPGAHRQWLAQLRPLVTDQLWSQLQYTADWRRATGHLLELKTAIAGDHQGTYRAWYSGVLEIQGQLVLNESGRWLVDTVAPVSATAV